MKKIYLTLLSSCLSFCGFSQLTLITPNNSGGFENGPTFAVNSWTAVNGAANQWAIGTGSINVGVRGAYIGDATNFVGTNTASTNHLYRSNPGMAIPAGATNVLLTFRYKQPVVDPGNDVFTVAITPTVTPTPVAGVPLSGAHIVLFQNSATVHAGYVQVGPIDLSAYAGLTMRLVLSYTNNGVAPIGIPAVDSFSVNYCPAGSVSGASSICQAATTVYSVSAGVPAGGVWSSSNSAVATASGTTTSTTVAGVSGGTANITYAFGTCNYISTITVNPTPGPISGTLSVCQGSTTSLTDVTPPGGTWNSSATAFATIDAAGTVTGVAPGVSNISYTAPVTGCRTVSQVTVNSLPTVFNVTGGGSFCASGSGVPVGLDNSTNGVDYFLSDGVSTVATVGGTGFPISFGLLTTASTYTVSATNTTTSCSNDMAGNAVITIAAPVTPSVSITSPTLVCSGTNGTYTAVPVNGGVTPAYQWWVNSVPAGVGSSLTYLPTNGDIISVTLYPGGICAVPDSAVTSYTAIVTTYSTPGVTIAVGPSNPSCQGSPVTFSATPSFGGATPIYRWTKNGINVATGPTYSYVPASGDVVYCMLTSNYTCRSIDTALSGSITMMVQPSAPVPVVNISVSPGSNFTPGATVTFTALISGGAGPVSYQWLINGSAVTGATSAVFTCSTLVNADIVTCKVTNLDPCGKSAVKSVLMSTGGGATAIEQTIIDGSGFTLMPNPNSGTFTVRGTTQSTQEVSLKINNVLGQTVYTKNATATGGVFNEQIVINNLPSGMYILYLNTNSQNQLIHFVVTN